ncbi:hypothetical protein [Aquabacterium sp. CECT 9606]|uniref:hypothetical protein n=1 Tax=Aquabacterium sp. CECT 9606 TaxID=2845822 RepID=UPI001E28FD47|nr:hypothetical protein [Aquabacterium sp. CECT 9606]
MSSSWPTTTIQSYQYALLKVLGNGSGLNTLRRDMAVRFTRKARAAQSPAPAA